MKKIYRVFVNITILTTVLLTHTNVYAQNSFDKWFKDNGLRIDYYHTGTDKTEQILFKELKFEEKWGGRKNNLIDKFAYGSYFVEVFDLKTKTLIYSYGFCSLFEEWQFTAEAKTISRGFPESLIIPFPKNKVKVELSSRQYEDNSFKKIFEIEIDPADLAINYEKPVNAEVKKIFGKLEPENALDLVFIGDGYTKNEIDSFYEDVQKTAEYLFETEPFKTNKEKINIWAVAAISLESGTDIPHEKIWKSTALNTNFYTFRSDRYLTTSDYHSVRDYAGLAPCDQICILVNTETYGGGGIYNFWNITSAKNSHRFEVFVHELGHSLAALGDEYYADEVSYEDIYNKKLEPYQANLTTLVNFDSKWKNMLDENTPIPTPVTKENLKTIGVYEGAGYQKQGIYRPYISCKMKSLGVDFCPVCQKAISEIINFYAE